MAIFSQHVYHSIRYIKLNLIPHDKFCPSLTLRGDLLILEEFCVMCFPAESSSEDLNKKDTCTVWHFNKTSWNNSGCKDRRHTKTSAVFDSKKQGYCSLGGQINLWRAMMFSSVGIQAFAN